jgi:hypothetical protein
MIGRTRHKYLVDPSKAGESIIKTDNLGSQRGDLLKFTHEKWRYRRSPGGSASNGEISCGEITATDRIENRWAVKLSQTRT